MADIVATIGLDAKEAESVIALLGGKIDELLATLSRKVEVGAKVDNGDLNDVANDFERAGKKAGDEFGDGVKKGVGGIGSTLTGVLGGLGIAEVFSKVTDGIRQTIELGSQFEVGMQSMSAVTGATGALLNTLGDDARNLAVQFGGSANDQIALFQTTLSKIGPELAQSPEQLAKFAENVNLLGKTDSALGAAGAVDALSGTMLQFGINTLDANEVARESSRFINVLAASAEVGSASVSDVADAISVVGATAHNANVSFEETNAALQVLAAKSLTGTKAGTALTSVMVRLQSLPIAANKELAKLGTSSAELGKLLTEQGLGAAIGRLRESMASMGSQAEKNALLNKLFGETGQNAASALLSEGEMLQRFTEGVTGTNSATEQAAKNMDSFAERMSRLKASVQDTMISAFQKIAPIIAGLMDDLLPRITSAVSGIGTALAPIAKGLAVVFGGAIYLAIQGFVGLLTGLANGLQLIAPILPVIAVAAAAYAVATNAAAIATQLAAVKQIIYNAAMNANPIGLVVLALTALVATLGYVADALSETAAEQLESAEAAKENLQVQIDQNKEQQKSVQTTQQMVARYKELASNTNRTKEETEELRAIQGKLDEQYPKLIDQTKSFADNLKGVEQIGNQSAAQMGKLTNEAKNLASTMAATTRQIAGLQRNVAIEELQDSFSRFSLWGGKEGQFRLDLQDQVDAYANALFKASNDDQVKAAQAKMLDFINLRGSELGDNVQLNDIINKILAAANKSSAALATWRGEADDTKKSLNELNATAVVPPPDDDGGADEAKKKTSELEKQIKLYKEQEATLKSVNNSRRVALELQRATLGDAVVDLQLKAIDKKEIEDLYAKAKELLKVTTDENGLFVSTAIKINADESANDIRDVITKLIEQLGKFKVPAELAITDVPLLLRNVRELKPIKVFNPDEVLNYREQLTKVDESLRNLVNTGAADVVGNIGNTIAASFSKATKKQSEELDKQRNDLAASLKSGEITYVEYTKRIGEADARLAQQNKSIWVDIAEASNVALAKAFDSTSVAMRTRFNDLTKDVTDISEVTGEAWQSLATSSAAAFASMVVSGHNAFKALIITALDALDALVPIFVAQITGIQLLNPTNAITFGASGLASAALLTAGLKALVAIAKAAVNAFASGGRVRGGEQLIRVNELGEEFVMNHRATRDNATALDLMNRGVTLPMMLSREDLRKKLGLDKLGIVFGNEQRTNMIAVQMMQQQQQPDKLLHQKLDSVVAELKQLKEKAGGTTNVKLSTVVDGDAMERGVSNRMLQWANKW